MATLGRRHLGVAVASHSPQTSIGICCARPLLKHLEVPDEKELRVYILMREDPQNSAEHVGWEMPVTKENIHHIK